MSQSVKLSNGDYIDSTGVWDGVSKKTLNTALQTLLYDGAPAHNSLYRGMNLGSTVTVEQYAAIADGTFKDLYVGDYWVINDITWRIGGFDYFYDWSNSRLTTHHCVIVPDSALTTSKVTMNASDTTEGGYAGSAMYTTILPDNLTIIQNSFDSSHILTHRRELVKSVTDGVPSASGWYDMQIGLLDVEMLTGATVLTAQVYGTRGNSQLPLFFYNPARRCCLKKNEDTRDSFWLADVYDSQYFFVWTGYMVLNIYKAYSTPAWCRPYFCLC